jgi:hypothetical protein
MCTYKGYTITAARNGFAIYQAGDPLPVAWKATLQEAKANIDDPIAFMEGGAA